MYKRGTLIETNISAEDYSLGLVLDVIVQPGLTNYLIILLEEDKPQWINGLFIRKAP